MYIGGIFKIKTVLEPVILKQTQSLKIGLFTTNSRLYKKAIYKLLKASKKTVYNTFNQNGYLGRL